MEVKLVVFDMDGVILDSERLANIAWFATSEKYGLGLTFDDLRKIKGGNLVRTKEILTNKFGSEMAEKILLNKKEKQLEVMAQEGGIKLKKGVKELLEFLKENNIKKVIATSTGRESATRNLKATGVYDYFDDFVFGNEVNKSKPDPEIFLKACEKAKVNIDNAVVIEDSVMGATAANKGNIKCIVVEDTIKFTSEEDKLAYKKFDSLLDVKNYFEKNKFSI